MSATGRELLVVEDDAEIRLFLRTALAAEGFQVAFAAAGAEALTMAAHAAFDLFIVDLGLPDMDGIDLVRAVRARTQAPLLILSAQTEEDRKIQALDAGADDYVTKPFGVGELRARIRAALRRVGEPPAVLELEGLRIDLDRRLVAHHGKDVHLTPIEFDLLARLARSAGRVVTHRQLLADVWGPEHVDQTHYLRIYMAQLRAKLEDDPAVPRFLLTDTGIGYRLAAE
ncbi:MAG TPA: response regulator [Burkholderiales bacterium]|jgi:two-component system KDP operon response regulator KdpE|nr:response regulator [Burkholderiales bacterium]